MNKLWGACPDYIIIYIKNINLKKRTPGIYNLMTFHNVPEGCILLFANNILIMTSYY
jgi:hypothetical protein